MPGAAADYHHCGGAADPDKLSFAAPPGTPAGANHADWSNCETPELCTLGFERKIPDCDGCTNDAFTYPALVFAEPELGPQLGAQPAACYAQDTAALNRSCPAPSDLHELFQAVDTASKPSHGTDAKAAAQSKLELSTVLNITSYLVWQMVTNFVDGELAASHAFRVHHSKTCEIIIMSCVAGSHQSVTMAFTTIVSRKCCVRHCCIMRMQSI
jgi:hypothetical protein